MKRLLLPLLAALALPTAVNGEVTDEIHNRCKDVSDYMGCVKANSKNEKFKLGENQRTFCDLEWESDIENCLQYSEKLGSKIFNVSFKNHEQCITLGSVNLYVDCLETKGENMVSFRKIPGLELTEFEKTMIDLNNPERIRKEIFPGVSDIDYFTFTYKGKTYKPSRECAKNEEMRWRKVGLFGRRLEELGCMTEKEHEAYWREYKMKKETRPIMIQRTNVNTNTTIEFR